MQLNSFYLTISDSDYNQLPPITSNSQFLVLKNNKALRGRGPMAQEQITKKTVFEGANQLKKLQSNQPINKDSLSNCIQTTQLSGITPIKVTIPRQPQLKVYKIREPVQKPIIKPVVRPLLKPDKENIVQKPIPEPKKEKEIPIVVVRKKPKKSLKKRGKTQIPLSKAKTENPIQQQEKQPQTPDEDSSNNSILQYEIVQTGLD